MASDRIRMMNMHFYGYHGVDQSERRLGGRFSMDVELVLDLESAGRDDDLSRTVDYKAIYDLVQGIHAGKPYRLLEALAHDVAQGILSAFPVDEVTVRSRKQSVPLGGLIDYTEVEITRRRDE